MINKQERAEKYERLAEKAEERSRELYSEAAEMMRRIDGQPLLVGHHSESADRSYRAKMDKKFNAAFEEEKKAEHYREKAKAAISSTAIYSDEPEAITKLKEKIRTLTEKQEHMKAVNRIIRLKPRGEKTPDKEEKLKAMGLTSEEIDKMFTLDYMGNLGYAFFELRNNLAKIKNAEKRLKALEREHERREKQAKEADASYDGFRIVENHEANRIQIIFNDKEAYHRICEEAGINLKRMGFRYSRKYNAWQRHLNNAGRWRVKEFIEKTRS